MEERNRPVEEPVVVKEEKIEEVKKEIIQEEKQQPKGTIERPYIGWKTEKIKEHLDKWRDMFNDSATEDDRSYSKNKISQLERELKKR